MINNFTKLKLFYPLILLLNFQFNNPCDVFTSSDKEMVDDDFKSNTCNICYSTDFQTVDDDLESGFLSIAISHKLPKHYLYVKKLIDARNLQAAYEETLKIIEFNENKVNEDIINLLLKELPFSEKSLDKYLDKVVESAMAGNTKAETYLKRYHSVTIRKKK